MRGDCPVDGFYDCVEPVDGQANTGADVVHGVAVGDIGLDPLPRENTNRYQYDKVAQLILDNDPDNFLMLGDGMNPKERGRVMGAYQTVQGIGNIIGFSALGVMYEKISPGAPILMCAVALAAATSIIALFVSETRRTGTYLEVQSEAFGGPGNG